MLKFGNIQEIDVAKGRAKVYFDADELLSGWLRISVKKSKTDKYDPTDYAVDEHVCCLMDEHAEEGVILCAVYSDNELPSGIVANGITGVTFSDGTRIQYKKSIKELKIDVGTGSVKLICSELNVDGDIKASGDVIAGLALASVSLKLHTHSGVTTGAGASGPPIEI